jgi:hypothetical protein
MASLSVQVVQEATRLHPWEVMAAIRRLQVTPLTAVVVVAVVIRMMVNPADRAVVRLDDSQVLAELQPLLVMLDRHTIGRLTGLGLRAAQALWLVELAMWAAEAVALPKLAARAAVLLEGPATAVMVSSFSVRPMAAAVVAAATTTQVFQTQRAAQAEREAVAQAAVMAQLLKSRQPPVQPIRAEVGVVACFTARPEILLVAMVDLASLSFIILLTVVVVVVDRHLIHSAPSVCDAPSESRNLSWQTASSTNLSAT